MQERRRVYRVLAQRSTVQVLLISQLGAEVPQVRDGTLNTLRYNCAVCAVLLQGSDKSLIRQEIT